jgi:hypothetical protein
MESRTVGLLLLLFVPSTIFSMKGPQAIPAINSPRTKDLLEKMVMMAPSFPDKISESDPGDSKSKDSKTSDSQQENRPGKRFEPKRGKRDAMGCKFGNVFDFDSSDDSAQIRRIPTRKDIDFQRSKKDDDLYFAMTELLRRIELGHDVDTKDLPPQLREEFERGMADGSLVEFLRDCEVWWELPPFNDQSGNSNSSHDGGRPPATQSINGGLPRSDYECISVLTFNGGGNEEYLWAQDAREVPPPLSSADCSWRCLCCVCTEIEVALLRVQECRSTRILMYPCLCLAF